MPTYNHIFDLTNPELPWQTLEAILSAYIDMIEAEKVVAVLDSLRRDSEATAAKPQLEMETREGNPQSRTRPWVSLWPEGAK